MLIGPESDDGKHRWYFSLNNRRLWVLKRCREEGLLGRFQNQILVRVREPKSQSERERYTLQMCAIEAKIIREKGKASKTLIVEDSKCTSVSAKWEDAGIDIPDQAHDEGGDEGDSCSSDGSIGSNDYDERKRNESNRFTALL